jgi:hypothetical protein
MMWSSLCRQFSSACQLKQLKSLSTAAAAGSRPEVVTVLKLNMLQDNPGAVKKVRVVMHAFYLQYSLACWRKEGHKLLISDATFSTPLLLSSFIHFY